MSYSRLNALISECDWKYATKELIEILNRGEWNDSLAVYAATIAFETGDKELAFDYISQGLEYNYRNYELYLMLGMYYEEKNINQAWLCYENAEYYCTDSDDIEIIRQYKQNAENKREWSVNKVSIVILTYNLKDISIQCINSIRSTNATDSYELIVVDNASTDGILEWLQEQKDIKLISNKENRGIPAGCNQGIKLANGENDILLLNSDTIVLPNSIFWLRMGLYENEGVGATGSVSNNCGNGQRIDAVLDGVMAYIKHGKKLNVPMKNPYEKKVFLSGFALLIKRKALNEVGMLDERFSPGQNEDADLGVRLNYAKWKLLLCHNSFIIHYGSGNGKNVEIWEKASEQTLDKFRQKWGFTLLYYSSARMSVVELIEQDRKEPISVLEVGCGCGATLAKIEHLWPNASVKGIELVEDIAKLGSNYLDIIQGNAESMELPYEENSFDYIILFDVLEHLYDPEKMLCRLMPYLKDNGKFLCSIPNIMNRHVICSLLQGKFEYQDAGILDRTHVRFFTLDSIKQMLHNCGLSIMKMNASYDEDRYTKEEAEMIEQLYQLPHIADKQLFNVYQYVFLAKKGE